jgi:hypothetical protein
MELSTFQDFLGGKGMFYVFMFPENEPVDKALPHAHHVKKQNEKTLTTCGLKELFFRCLRKVSSAHALWV